MSIEERLAAAPLVALARAALARWRRRSLDRGRRGARRGPAGGEVADLDLAVAGSPEAAAKAIAGAGRGARLRALGRVRDLAGGRPRQAPGRWTLTALRGETIEADLAERDFTIGAVAVPLAGRRAASTRTAASPTSSAASCGSSARAASPPTRCGCCARRGSRPSSSWRSTRARVTLARAEAGRAGEPAGERQLVELRRLIGGADPLRGLALLDELGLTAGRPARARRAARRRAGPQPPPRRPRPHARGARADARGRGATSSASPASAPARPGRCSTSRSPTR